MELALPRWLARNFVGACGIALITTTIGVAQQDSPSAPNQLSNQPQNQATDAGDVAPELDGSSRNQQDATRPRTESPQQNSSQQGQFAQGQDQQGQNQQGSRQQEQRQQAQTQQGQQRPGLGVTLGEAQQGARVLGVYPDSPAGQAGLQPGDIIVSFDEQNINSVRGLVGVIQQQSPGDSVTMQVLRNGQNMQLQATLGSEQEVLGQTGRQTSFYRGGRGDTPWGQNDITQHIEALEEEIRMLTREIQDMKAMLGTNPDGMDRSRQTQQQDGSAPTPPSGATSAGDGQDQGSQNYDFEEQPQN